MLTARILVGDCVRSMSSLADGSVDCCVTSPPYFGLRDYGVEGQIGLEETPGEYVASIVSAFRSVRRVLNDHGTVWLNLGDSYCNAGSNRNGEGFGGERRGGYDGPDGATGYKKRDLRTALRGEGIKHKDLMVIPWRVAFALQDDGWHLRQDIIWSKPNPMPESVKYRCTKAHEYIFLLTKSPRYYFDHEAIKEPAVYAGQSRGGSTKRYEQNAAGMDNKVYDTRNKRSVWTVCPKPFKGAHFATFPPELIEPCVLAGCPLGGTVLDPFGGSGTTAEVALKNGRSAILCELNPNYAEMSVKRLSALGMPLFREHQVDQLSIGA